MRRGAALFLSVYLVAWIPLKFALEFLSTISSLRMRGTLAFIELAAHGIVAAFCVAADRMLNRESPGAFTAASVAVLLAGGAAIQSLYWTVLPRDVAPGTRLPLLALTIAVTGIWLVVLQRARR